VRVYNISVQKL